ncbi:MAG: chromate transporter, partial [Alcanivorax sp.]|nr:chromate transporter [Alcanivorax sp.]
MPESSRSTPSPDRPHQDTAVSSDGNLNEFGHQISFGEAVRVWLRIAILSFGGPAGQIAVMHRILVDEKRWVSESRFLHALNYCMVLPGPEAQQLATYIGWLLHGVKGGLVAGSMDISFVQYVTEIQAAMTLTQVGVGLSKSVVFGALIAMAGCRAGIQSGRSSAAVGQAATTAVV